jgi:hypothetical protein
MSERLSAHFENRIYYFTVESRKPGELKIMMYGTLYTFLQTGERWLNHAGNLMEMKTGLVAAVMLSAGEV